jgi:hypothetical protein
VSKEELQTCDENSINFMRNLTVYNPEIIMVINLSRCYTKCTREIIEIQGSILHLKVKISQMANTMEKNTSTTSKT